MEDRILEVFKKPETREQAEAFLERANKLLQNYNAVAQAIGELAMVWAALDAAVDELFEPLLECSDAQVACILVENINARCEMVKKLLHVEPLPPKWVEWVEALLGRTSGELASRRNRFIHDNWTINSERATRSDKRAKVGKAQSRQKRALKFRTEHDANVEEIDRLAQQVITVALALKVATKSLRAWRTQGRRPRVLKQWLPASKQGARMLNYLADGEAFEKLLVRLQYEFD